MQEGEKNRETGGKAADTGGLSPAAKAQGLDWHTCGLEEARDLPEEMIHVVNFPVLEAGAKMRVLRRGTECVWCIPLTLVTDWVPGALLDSGDGDSP